MNDFTANHISTEEATELLQFANSEIADSRLEFIPGVSYRNLLVYPVSYTHLRAHETN